MLLVWMGLTASLVQAQAVTFQQIKSFGFTNDPAGTPQAKLVEGLDGALYGTTTYGGLRDQGVLFKIKKDGTGYAILRHFGVAPGDGRRPSGSLVRGADGKLYGATCVGGALGGGTVYRLDTNGSGFQIIHSFPTNLNYGAECPNPVVEGPDGVLYGTAVYGGGNDGSVFKVNKDGTGYTVLYLFNSLSTNSGEWPSCRLLSASDGALYGTARYGGIYSFGIGFKINRDGTGFRIVHHFGGSGDGRNSEAEFIEGSNGALYGATPSGGVGQSASGTVFGMNKDGSSYSVLHTFDNTVVLGQTPRGTLIEASDGFLYGATQGGGTDGVGTLFKLAKNGSGFAVLHSFLYNVSANEPRNPEAGLIEASDGILYGTTQGGGLSDDGAVFKIAKDGSLYGVLRTFSRSGGDACKPISRLIEASDGMLYGSAYSGGTNGSSGGLFRFDKAGAAYSVLHGFIGTDGSDPSELLEASDGMLYGTTIYGVNPYAGRAFRLNRDGSGFQVIRVFGNNDLPSAPFVEGPDGALYSATRYGGTAGQGVIFKMNKDGSAYTVLRNFSTGGDAVSPSSPLLLGSDGALYGLTSGGGTAGLGALFRINRDGTSYAVLHSFGGTAGDGKGPHDALFQDASGVLYGATWTGGANDAGTVFSVNQNGTGYQVLYSFGGAALEARNPNGGLAQGIDGAFYGTAQYGGQNGLGAVFRLNRAGCYTAVYSFVDTAFNGVAPVGGLMRASDGALYGATFFGGDIGIGSIFGLTTPPACMQMQCPTGVVFRGCSDTVPISFSASAKDTCNPALNVTLSCVPPSGGVFSVGTTLVRCSASDSSGVTECCAFPVTILPRDTAPPIFNCADQTLFTHDDGLPFCLSIPATDDLSSNVTVACVPPFGSVLPLGATRVSCTATDSCQNLTLCDFTITVLAGGVPATNLVSKWSQLPGYQFFHDTNGMYGGDRPSDFDWGCLMGQQQIYAHVLPGPVYPGYSLVSTGAALVVPVNQSGTIGRVDLVVSRCTDVSVARQLVVELRGVTNGMPLPLEILPLGLVSIPPTAVPTNPSVISVYFNHLGVPAVPGTSIAIFLHEEGTNTMNDYLWYGENTSANPGAYYNLVYGTTQYVWVQRYNCFPLLTVYVQPYWSSGDWVIADDFRSDGRPILTVRWWGSYLNGYGPGFEDTFVLSFFRDVPRSATNSFSQPGELLATYIAPTTAVRSFDTGALGWDMLPIWQYEVDLKDTCLDHPNTNYATPTAFLEKSNIIYWLAIDAEVGHTIGPLTNYDGTITNWFEISTGKQAFNHFWGWHTSPSNWNDISVMGHVAMEGSNWVYGRWMTNDLFHMEIDQAFELLTVSNWGPPRPDLRIRKSASTATAAVASNVTYTIVVSNMCAPLASNVVVADPFPAGFKFLAANSTAGSCAFDATSNVLTCSLGVLPAFSNATITISGTFTNLGTKLNVATVTSAFGDANTNDNRHGVFVFVVPSSDLLALNVPAPSPVPLGGLLTYAIGISNRGPNTATVARLSTTLPSGVTFVTNSGAGNCTNAFDPLASPQTFFPRWDFPTPYPAYALAAGDLDGDGKIDLVVLNADATEGVATLLRNTSADGDTLSSNTISFVTAGHLQIGTGASSVLLADLDCDGRLDLALANVANDTVWVFRNQSSPGTFSSNSFAPPVVFSTGFEPRQILARDLNGDGKPDLVTVNSSSGGITILRNNTVCGIIDDSSFVVDANLLTGRRPVSVAVGDLDGDGRADIVTANAGATNLSVLRNLTTAANIVFGGSATLALPVGSLGPNPTPSTVNIADVNSDGKADIIVVAGTKVVFPNRATPGTLNSNSFAPAWVLPISASSPVFAVSDLNADHKPEILSLVAGGAVSVLRNDSTSNTISFTLASSFSTAPGSVAGVLADLTGDAKPEIATANSNRTVSVLRNFTQNPSINCALPDLAPGAAVIINLVVEPPARPGFLTNSVTVTNANFDPALADNLAIAVVEVTGPVLAASPLFNGTNATLSFLAEPGVTYIVEYQDSLTAPWIFLRAFDGVGAIVNFTDVLPTPPPPSRFYRIRIQP